MTSLKQPRSRVTSAQRHSRRHPCPICGGGYDDRHGRGVRCYGFTSTDGRYAHCTREDYARALSPDAHDAYPHRLDGPCRCGASHSLRPSQRMPHTRPTDPRSNQPATTLRPDSPAASPDHAPPRTFRRHSDLPTRTRSGLTLTHTYLYHTASGALAFEVRRFERPSSPNPPGSPDSPIVSRRRDKTLLPYTPRPDGSWIEALSAPRVLYRLPEILSTPT